MASSVGTAYLTLVPKLDKGAISAAESKIGASGTSSGNSFNASFGSALKKIAGLAVVAEAGELAGKAIADAFNASARNEQLVGGAKLLFGDDVAKEVIANARGAFREIQISQNEYLEQANSYAVGLKTSMNDDAAAAANLADKIVRAQADVISATGATRDSVQNAFAGIMRGNFTMVDNLQLGIKPTKEGYQEMIDTVNEWNAAQGHATEYQMDNLADMEAALVDYVEMQGLAGTAANEAAGTTEGALAKLGAAWENLLTDIGNGENIEESVNDFMTAFEESLEVLIPVASRVIASLIAALPDLLWGVFTIAINEMAKWYSGFEQEGAAAIRGVRDGIVENIYQVVSAAGDVVIGIADELASLPGKALQWGQDIAKGIADGIKDFAGNVTGAAGGLAGDIASFLHFSEPDVGPLSNFHTYMPDMMSLMAKGIRDNRGLVQREVNGVADMMAGGLSMEPSAGFAASVGSSNIYVNNARVNNDREIQRMFGGFMQELKRKGAM